MAKSYQHWRLETDDDRIGWLYADKSGESTNSLSREMLDELAEIVDEIEGDTPRGLVILSAKKNGFIAGADINTIAEAKTTEQAAEFIRHGQGIFNRIEKYTAFAWAVVMSWRWPAATVLPWMTRAPNWDYLKLNWASTPALAAPCVYRYWSVPPPPWTSC